MTIDRARNSYNPTTRDWRGVLAQQGRVTLEADVNEQARIAAETQRLETLAVIGPVGTPDGGYEVSVSGGDIQISPGTLYLGGIRLTLAPPGLATNTQPGWLDMPPWPAAKGNEIVALLATEQTVIAVEDEALREVALGGPDSAGRLALLQHVLRLPADATSCAAAAAALPKLLNEDGLTYDAGTCELTSPMRLQVTLVEPAAAAGPCDPPASGGYLGADNQMIRVAVTKYDSATGKGELVWGWNNASFLYRATVAQDDSLTFLADPLDPDHTPQQSQAVEVLRCTADLGDGDRSFNGGGNFIAAGAGEMFVLGAAPYASGTRLLTLPHNLNAAHLGDAPRPLFVRLWQMRHEFTAGAPVTLGETGLAVTITDPAVPSIGGRPFWQFAVRPSTPAALYPDAYLTAPQPPDGPRQFLATLGVCGGNSDGLSLLENCTVPFLPLTELQGCDCCDLTLDPAKDWLATLRQAIATDRFRTLNICFQPGVYEVRETISIRDKHVKMTGAGSSSRLFGATLEKVLEFIDCPSVCLSDFAVAAGASGYFVATGMVGLQGAVTLRDCVDVVVERLSLSCAAAELRAASCLAIYNPVPQRKFFERAAAERMATAIIYSARVLNCRLDVGNSQVGILLVHADRAWVEGNLIVNAPVLRVIKYADLGQNKYVAARLRKQLLHGLTVEETAPPTSRKAKARLRKREAKRAAAQPAAAQPAAAQPAAAQPAAVQTDKRLVKTSAAAIAPRAGLGRARVKASFGTIRVGFTTSDRLSSTWTDALNAANLSATSKIGAVHKAVKQIAKNVILNPQDASFGFQNWFNAVLPQLYSTSGQGIVVGGNQANDVRILNNSIDGSAQGIHVGLSDIKLFGKGSSHLLATRVQIRGNTINIRLAPDATGDRHGIYLGCVTSGVISDNHLELTDTDVNGQWAQQNIDAIKVAGFFGPLLLIERNSMMGFTTGINTAQDATSPPDNVLWKVADNASDVDNQITGGGMFIETDNLP